MACRQTGSKADTAHHACTAHGNPRVNDYLSDGRLLLALIMECLQMDRLFTSMSYMHSHTCSSINILHVSYTRKSIDFF